MSDLAILAGQGALPAVILDHHPQAWVCEMDQVPVAVPSTAQILPYRVETLGTLIADLKHRGVTRLCCAGAMGRPAVDPARIDAQTLPLVPAIMAAIGDGGDDATLRAALAIFEQAGFDIVAAHDLVPDLMPKAGVLTGNVTDALTQDAARGMQVLDHLSGADLGQSCVVAAQRVIAVEAAPGTDWMLASLRDGEAWGGAYIKAAKIGQDRRVDVPAIGPDTIQHAHDAGLRAVVIEAGGVMILDRAVTVAAAQARGMTLWVRGR